VPFGEPDEHWVASRDRSHFANLVVPLRLPLATDSSPDPQVVRALLEDARARRLAPFLYLLAAREPQCLPPDLLRELRGCYLSTLRRNLLLHKELGGILGTFDAACIRVIPLKGTLLGLRLYGNLARPSADIDLLVRREDIPRAHETLTRRGYVAAEDEGQCDIAFHRSNGRAGPLVVELHRSLGYFARAGEGFVTSIWRRASLTQVDGLRIWQMDPTDELLWLCLHMVRHYFEEPSTALDIHLAVERWKAEIDWDRLVDTARRFRLRYQVALALAFAQHWFQTALPDAVAAALAPPRWRRAYFEWAEWQGNIVRLLRSVPLRRHWQDALRLPLLDETWRDQLEHVSHVVRSIRRRVLRGLRNTMGGRRTPSGRRGRRPD